MFESAFFGTSNASVVSYADWVRRLSENLTAALPLQPFSGAHPEELSARLKTNICPAAGLPEEALHEKLRAIIGNSIALWHPHTAAHLHTPVLLPALAAEMMISALNQSLDSFDQAPAATIIEQHTLDWLCSLVGFNGEAGGTFTAGGTQSNYMALLLARDHFLETKWNWSARQYGLPSEACQLRILCSEMAHFSVEKAAIQLGLGLQAVVRVACDEQFRMKPDDLKQKISSLREDGMEPFAVVATAGTTDFGSFDPLERIVTITRMENIWLHVDAAYGGATLMSPRLRDNLKGLERADSVTLDFHKAFFQPISCGAFLLRDQQRFNLIRLHADYLNSESREQAGIPDLVTRSVLTTRRFDALKLWLSLQAVGQNEFAAMIERLHTLACAVAAQIIEMRSVELLHSPQFGCVVFRFVPDDINADAEAINEAIPRRLFEQGKAVLGHTKVRGKSCLKLTINNPCAHPAQLVELLKQIIECGHSLSETSVCHYSC